MHAESEAFLPDEVKSFREVWRSFPSETRAKFFNLLRQQTSNKIIGTPDGELSQLKQTVKAITIIESQLNQLVETGKLT